MLLTDLIIQYLMVDAVDDLKFDEQLFRQHEYLNS